MFRKVIIIWLLLFPSLLIAHKVAGVEMQVEKLEANKIKVEAYFKRSKRPLVGNEVRLISMFDHRVLSSGKLSSKGLILKIPNESYWVYVLVRDNDIVKDGPPPNEGFQKTRVMKKEAFNMMLGVSLGLLILTLIVSLLKRRRFLQSLNKEEV